MSELTTKQKLFVEASIYGIFAGENCFYVGSTVKSVNDRFHQHLTDVQKGRHCNFRFAQMVRKVGANNCVIRTLGTSEIEDRFTAEYRILNEMKDLGHDLTNIVCSLEQDERLQQIRTNRLHRDQQTLALALRRFAMAFDVANKVGAEKEKQLSKELIQACFIDHQLQQYIGKDIFRQARMEMIGLGVYGQIVTV